MRRLTYSIPLALLAAGPLFAQASGSTCNGPQTTASADACQKATDLFSYMAPQLGIAVTGGNATLGQGGTLGGPGHFVVEARVNGLDGSVPDIASVTPSTAGPQQSTYATGRRILGLPQVDAAIGLFKGIPLGLTNVAGVDLLVSAGYVPNFSSGSIRVSTPNGSLKLGAGVRVGVLQESFIFPGISATYFRRDLPNVDITATSGGDSLNVRNLSERTEAFRLVASKSFFIFGIAVGAGQDRYRSAAAVNAYLAPRALPPTGAITGAAGVSQKLTRNNYFADLSLNFPFIKIVGEIGQVSGGKVDTFNRFEGKAPAASRLFGSVGLRLGF